MGELFASPLFINQLVDLYQNKLINFLFYSMNFIIITFTVYLDGKIISDLVGFCVRLSSFHRLLSIYFTFWHYNPVWLWTFLVPALETPISSKNLSSI